MNDIEKLQKLIELLEKAENLVSMFSGGYTEKFNSVEEFHDALSESLNKLKSGELNEILKLDLWFLPTCDWDDFIGTKGVYLAQEISDLLSELKISFKIFNIIDIIID